MSEECGMCKEKARFGVKCNFHEDEDRDREIARLRSSLAAKEKELEHARDEIKRLTELRNCADVLMRIEARLKEAVFDDPGDACRWSEVCQKLSDILNERQEGT